MQDTCGRDEAVNSAGLAPEAKLEEPERAPHRRYSAPFCLPYRCMPALARLITAWMTGPSCPNARLVRRAVLYLLRAQHLLRAQRKRRLGEHNFSRRPLARQFDRSHTHANINTPERFTTIKSQMNKIIDAVLVETLALRSWHSMNWRRTTHAPLQRDRRHDAEARRARPSSCLLSKKAKLGTAVLDAIQTAREAQGHACETWFAARCRFS